MIGLFSFANSSTAAGAVGVGLAALLIAGGLLWFARYHRKVKERDEVWHRAHPEVPYEPPTS